MSSHRPFAGYWEYLLDNAISTIPHHHRFGEAALVDPYGSLLGIGSLFARDAQGPTSQAPGNMFVPIGLVKPILHQMINTGRSVNKPHPWVGVHTSIVKGRVYITKVAIGGTGEEAGLKPGDIIVDVSEKRVFRLAVLFHKMWSQCNAGVKIKPNVLTLGPKSREFHDVFIH